MTTPRAAVVLRISSWGPLFGGTIALFALGKLCVLLASLDGNISPVWPATGLAAWLLIVRGVGMWPAVAIAQLLVNHFSGIPLPVAAEMAGGNVAEALLAAWLWHRGQERWQSQLGAYCTLGCTLAVAAGAPLAAASVGTGSLYLGNIIPAAATAKTWITWWTGDALGVLFVLPVLLSAPALGRWLRHASSRDLIKVVVILALAGAVCGVAFFLPNLSGLVFGIFPVLLLASRWIDAPVSGVVAGLIAAAAIMGTAGGNGPFVTGNLNYDLLVMQLFLASAAIMAQLLPTFRERGSLLPSIILLVGWTLSGVIFASMRQNQARTDESNFAALTSNAATDIENRLAIYIDALRNGASFLHATPEIGPKAWEIFVKSMDLAHRYPGINGLGLILPVAPEATNQFLATMRSQGMPDFLIHAVPGESASSGREQYVVTQFAPGDGNAGALGLDVATEATRREAADEARDTGEPQMTGHVTLVQEGQKQTGFLVYLPVYRLGAPLTTVAERRVAFRGWIYAPFVTQNFLQGILGRRKGIINLWFFERGQLDSAHLLYSSEKSGTRSPKFKRVRALRLAGQSFTLGWNVGPEFRSVGISITVWTSLSLAFGTLLLAALVRSLQNFRQRADQLTAERTLELRAEIDRHEQTDRALRDVSSFQLAILESASIAIISTTPDGVVRTFNPAAQRMLGYAEAEIVGKETPRIFHDPDEVVARATQFGLELGCIVEPGFDVFVIKSCRNLPNEHEWTYLRKDGSRLPVLLSVTAIRDGAGTFVGFLGMAVDISERQRHQRQIIAAQQASEAALHEVEQQRDAVDQHAIVSVSDAGGRIQNVNSKFCTISGYARENLIGQNHRLINSGHHPFAFWSEFWQTIRSGQIWHGEVCNRSRRGELYWVASTVVPFLNRDGAVERFMAISTDITTRKNHEAALVASQRAAESASRAKSEFLAVMSHEIRTPMNAVIGFTELLIDSPLQPEQRDHVEIIRSSGQNLIALINDILDFSKIEAGKLAVDCVRFDGISAVESVAKTLALQADAKGLSLTAEFSRDLPRLINADPMRLRQVLINLVGNAIKFTGHGGITIRTTRALTLGSGALRISVVDTGIGIPLNKQPMLFEKFAQADASITREFGGTGLGLAICKRLVELMGGKIGLASVAGEGSTFWFELPLAVDQNVAEATRPKDPTAPPMPFAVPIPAGQADVPKRKVLIADDNRLNQLLLRTFLTKLNCEFVVANNGVEAVNLVQTQPFDLVLMDHQMPIMDGCEAATTIRTWERAQRRPRPVPIIAITANAMEFGHDFYRAAGMNAYLTKPLLMPQLERAMAAVLLEPDDPPSVPARTGSVDLAPLAPVRAMDPAAALQFADNDPALLGLLVDAFVAQGDEFAQGIKQAIASRDPKALRQTAHKLKGAVSVFAAEPVALAADALEHLTEPPNWPSLEQQAAQLEIELRRLLAELAALPDNALATSAATPA